MTKRKYSIDNLKEGMRVYKSNLNDIKGYYITLVDSVCDEKDIIGTIAYIGKRLNRKSDKISRTNSNIVAIYNSPEDIEDKVTFDE